MTDELSPDLPGDRKARLSRKDESETLKGFPIPPTQFSCTVFRESIT